jgi:hypothetical protein
MPSSTPQWGVRLQGLNVFDAINMVICLAMRMNFRVGIHEAIAQLTLVDRTARRVSWYKRNEGFVSTRFVRIEHMVAVRIAPTSTVSILDKRWHSAKQVFVSLKGHDSFDGVLVSLVLGMMRVSLTKIF